MVEVKIRPYVGLVLVLFSLFTISPWYLFNNEKYYEVKEEKVYLNDLEAEKVVKIYNPERRYYVIQKSQFLVEKSKIPFFRKKTFIKKITSEMFSRRK